MAEELRKQGKKMGLSWTGMEGDKESHWVLIDFDELVIHIFTNEWRDHYNLERLWGDAPKIKWKEGQTPEGYPEPQPGEIPAKTEEVNIAEEISRNNEESLEVTETEEELAQNASEKQAKDTSEEV